MKHITVAILFGLLALPAAAQAAPDPLEAPLPKGAIARLGTTRFRAGGSVGRLVIARDGKLMLTVIDGGYAVQVWDLATGQLLRRISSCTVCYQADFSHDGKRLLINDNVPTGKAAWTSVLKIYEIASGKLVRALEGSKGLGTFALSPDGRTLALEFVAVERQEGPSDFVYKSHLELRDFETDRLLHSFGEQRTTGPMGWLRFTPDGKTLFAVSAEMSRTQDVQSTVRQFDCATAKLKAQMKIDWLHYATITPVWNKGLLATGNKIWDLEKGKLRTTLVGGDKRWSRGENVVGLLPDGKSAIVSIPARMEHFQGRYGTGAREVEPARLVLWDIDNDKEMRRLPDHWNGFITPDAKSSFTVSMGGAIRRWDLASGKEILPKDGPDETARVLVFSPDQKRLAAVGHTFVRGQLSDYVSVWDLGTGKRIHHQRFDEILHFYGLSQFTPDGQTFLLGGRTRVHTLDLATWQHGKRTLDGLGIEADAADVARAQLSPDGKTVAVAYSNIRGEAPLSNAVTLWDWTTGKKIGTLKDKDKEAVQGSYPTAFSADGKWFAAVILPANAPPLDNVKGEPVPYRPVSLQIWSVADRKVASRWQTTESHLTFLRFGPDGKTLVGGFWNRKVCIWDSATGKEKLRFDIPTEQPTNVHTEIAPDGTLAASADQNSNLVRFWDLASGKQTGEFRGAPGYVTSLAFTPDSRLLAVGGSDTTVLIVDVRKVVK